MLWFGRGVGVRVLGSASDVKRGMARARDGAEIGDD